MEPIKIAVIGGSGLYNMPAISDVEDDAKLIRPLARPAAPIRIGSLGGKRSRLSSRAMAMDTSFRPRPCPYRANIYALEARSASASSLPSTPPAPCTRTTRPAISSRIDQIIDYTIQTRRAFLLRGWSSWRISQSADPMSEYLRADYRAMRSRRVGGTAYIAAGTILVEDGPRFATRAESHLFRAWGCHLIGMTSAPEAFLAREAEIAYASLAHVTDFDSWHSHEADVTSELVIETLFKNIELVRRALAIALAQIDKDYIDPAHTALGSALATPRDAMDANVVDRLRPILARVLNLD